MDRRIGTGRHAGRECDEFREETFVLVLAFRRRRDRIESRGRKESYKGGPDHDGYRAVFHESIEHDLGNILFLTELENNERCCQDVDLGRDKILLKGVVPSNPTRFIRECRSHFWTMQSDQNRHSQNSSSFSTQHNKPHVVESVLSLQHVEIAELDQRGVPTGGSWSRAEYFMQLSRYISTKRDSSSGRFP
jgi:hypothetical protein